MLHCNNNEERDRCKVNMILKSSTQLLKNYNQIPGFKIKTSCTFKGEIITSQKKILSVNALTLLTHSLTRGSKAQSPVMSRGSALNLVGLGGEAPKTSTKWDVTKN